MSVAAKARPALSEADSSVSNVPIVAVPAEEDGVALPVVGAAVPPLFAPDEGATAAGDGVKLFGAGPADDGAELVQA